MLDKRALFAAYPAPDEQAVHETLLAELKGHRAKIVVMDDDPTGIQTVSGIHVYTDWSEESIREGLSDPARRLFFILTNSRAFSPEKAREVNGQIARRVMGQTKDFILVSRGDSTLRGHYPLETQVLRETLRDGGMDVDGEIIFPFFPEGGRYTAEDVHYVAQGEKLIPAGETEFARDRTFGYESSNLRDWVQEKTGGAYPADQVVSIALGELRAADYAAIQKKLMGVAGFGKVVVNALCYADVEVFVTAFYRAYGEGKRFLFRSAAALVRVLGGIAPRPLLSPEELRDDGNKNGGLIIVGSHVKKTTEQLQRLRARRDIAFVEVNQHLVVDEAAFDAEIDRALAEMEQNIAAGQSVAVYTRRERFDLNTGNKDDELRLAARISDRITSLVERLETRPSFLIAKGGITSSDVGTKGLGVRRALVLGQILPGVPVWRTGAESRFPGLSYVIFPGNVGDEDALDMAVSMFL